MAFSAPAYTDLIRRAEQDQSTVEGRLARHVLMDPTWPFTGSATTQKARVASNIGDKLKGHSRDKDRGNDSTSLQVIIDEWVVRAGG
jgi:hypothetical protein